MCSTPKPASPPPAKPEKPPVYMRNQYLDGLGINSENAGRNSLRIDLGSGPVPTRPTTPPSVTPGYPRPPIIGNPGGPGLGIGSGGGPGGGRPRIGIRLP